MFRPEVLLAIVFGTVVCLGGGSACRKTEEPPPETTAKQKHSEAASRPVATEAEVEADAERIAPPSSDSATASAQETTALPTIGEAPDGALESLEQEILAKWKRGQSFTATVMTHTQEDIDGGEIWMDGLGTYECKRKNGDVFFRLDQNNTAGQDLNGQRSKNKFRVLTIGDRNFVHVLTEYPGTKRAEKHLPKAFVDLYLGGQGVFDRIRELYVPKRLPDAELDGRPVYAISGVSKNTGVHALYYFDHQTGAVVRIRLEDTSRNLYRTITLIDFEISPDLPDERFIFTPPEGVEIVDLTASKSP